MGVINRERVVPFLKDQIQWDENASGVFTKRCYSKLEVSSHIQFPSKFFWSKTVPSIIGLFAWEASLVEVFTRKKSRSIS